MFKYYQKNSGFIDYFDAATLDRQMYEISVHQLHKSVGVLHFDDNMIWRNLKTHHNLRLNKLPNSTTAKIKKKGRPFQRYHLNNKHYVIKLINSLITQINYIPLIFSFLAIIVIINLLGLLNAHHTGKIKIKIHKIWVWYFFPSSSSLWFIKAT